MPKADGTQRGRHRSGRQWERIKVAVFALHGRTCVICGHAGAGEVGHVKAAVLSPADALRISNLRPMHGSNAPCRHCLGREGRPRCCNQEQGTRDLSEMFRPKTDW
jgi:hypothetical protein